MHVDLPAHLRGASAQGPAKNSKVAQYELGDYRNFVYLILDRDRPPAGGPGRAAIVDPRPELEEPLRFLESEGFALDTILLTHTHWDHVGGVPALIERFPGIALRVHAEDLHRLKPAEARAARAIRDGERIRVGSLEVAVLHTPGHSPGECSYFLEASGGEPPFLFTGDTVFVQDCGRTDLEGGSTRQMFDSIGRIRRLPPETVILPGHHYRQPVATTLARELRESPPFLCASVEELEALP